MRNGRTDVAQARRQEIVRAAVKIIAEKGIDSLSLSAIEGETGMKRGQLTYYFRFKEDILLAVFDHTVETMRQRVGARPCPEFEASGWAMAQFLVRMMLTMPTTNEAFGPLQHAFLAQMSHREDYRRRLAGLYEEWRGNMAASLANDLKTVPDPPPYSPRALATVIQALLHGLAVQRAADPDATADPEVLAVCFDMLGSYLRTKTPQPRTRRRAKTPSKKAKS
jgi:AcrR family transcriptional regulator